MQEPEPVTNIPQPLTFKDFGIFLLRLFRVLVVVAILEVTAENMSRGTALEPVLRAFGTPLSHVTWPASLLCALLITRRVPRGMVWHLRELWSPYALLAVAAGIAVKFTAQVGFALADPLTRALSFKRVFTWMLETNKLQLSWTALILTVAGTCILTPVAEEWLFRGFLQPLLVRRWGALVGILVTAVVFTLLHQWSVGTLLTIGAFSLIQGYVAYRSRSLTYLILMHAAYNLTAIWPEILRSLAYLKVL